MEYDFSNLGLPPINPLNKENMKQTIRVFVRVPDRLHAGKLNEIYRNKLTVDDSVTFDYSVIIKALKLLYPDDNNVIEFEISN